MNYVGGLEAVLILWAVMIGIVIFALCAEKWPDYTLVAVFLTFLSIVAFMVGATL